MELINSRIRLQNVAFNVVLLATAFQAVTPDPNSVASARAFRLMCVSSDGSDWLPEDDELQDLETATVAIRRAEFFDESGGDVFYFEGEPPNGALGQCQSHLAERRCRCLDDLLGRQLYLSLSHLTC